MLLLVAATGAFAQAGSVSLGPALGFGTKSTLSTPSVGIKLNYNPTSHLELSPSFNYYFSHKGVNAWDINVDGHYVFNVGSGFDLYPIVGLSLFHASQDNPDVSETKVGLNLGGGARYNFNNRISLGLELKYVIVSNWGGLTPSLNLMFRL